MQPDPIPSLVVVQVGKEHIFGDGFCQGSHRLVVFWNNLWKNIREEDYFHVPGMEDREILWRMQKCIQADKRAGPLISHKGTMKILKIKYKILLHQDATNFS